MQTIQIRRGIAKLWTEKNPILASGEFGFETDTGKVKIGNGETFWQDLAYLSGGGGSAAWGAITGTLSAQADLQAALDSKASDTLTYITVTDESLELSNARRLAAGTGINLIDNGAGNTLEIESTGAGIGYYEPLTNGNLTFPELIFADGDVIMVFIP